jgi:hypothetical protein
VTCDVAQSKTKGIHASMNPRAFLLIILALSQMAYINVANFGATGDGSDQTAAINAAIASAGAGDTVYLPAGTYQVSSTIRAANVRGLRLIGDGEFVTVIVPTDSLAGQSVIQLVDAMDSTIEGLSVFGDSGAPPAAAIESLSATPGEASHLIVRDVEVGSLSANSLVDGIKFDYGPNADYNNDLGYFDDVTVSNFEHAAYEFIGINSLVHLINGGAVKGGPIGVYCQGGAFRAVGTFFSVSDVVFDFDNTPSQQHPFYEHPIMVEGIATEGSGGLLRTATAPIAIRIAGADVKFASGKVIDFESPQGQLFITGSYFNFLDPSATLSFTGGRAQMIDFTDNFVDLNSVTLNGNFTSQGNCWTGKPKMRILGPSHFIQRDNLCDPLAPGRR